MFVNLTLKPFWSHFHRRESRTKAMEIDERNVTWHEDTPFAHGSFGAVYRVTYERRIVAAKMVSLRDVPQNALESTKKEYKKEVALMGEVREWGGGELME